MIASQRPTSSQQIRESQIDPRISPVVSITSDKVVRRPSPPMFKYKVKYVAKQFDPFKEYEEQQLRASCVALQEDDKQDGETQIKQPIVEQEQEHQSQMGSMKFKKFNSAHEQQEGGKKDNAETKVVNNNSQKQQTIPNGSFVNNDSNVQTKKKQSRPATAAVFRQNSQTTIKNISELENEGNTNTIKNIFEKAVVYETYSKNQIGPQYLADGKIKEYSLVGKPEWFIKQQKISNNSNNPLNQVQFNVDQGSQMQIPRAVSANILSNSRSHLGQRVKVKEENFIVQELEIEEVEECIQQVQKRVKENEQSKQKSNQIQLQKLRKGDRLYATQQERVIQKFDNKQKQVLKMVNNNCKKVNKEIQDSCLLRDQESRTKYETRQLLDLVQTDHEKYGDQFWKNGLRRPKEDRDEIVDKLKARGEGKQTRMYDNCSQRQNQWDESSHIKVIEQIRKPISSILRNENQNKLPYHTFGCHELLENKISSKSLYVNQLYQVDSKQLEGLQIQGTNILKSEVNSLLKSSPSSHFVLKIPPNINTHNDQNDPTTTATDTTNRKYTNSKQSDTNTARQSKTSQGLRTGSRHQAQEPALKQFLNKKDQAQEEEEIIEVKYLPVEMKRGGYVVQNLKLKY